MNRIDRLFAIVLLLSRQQRVRAIEIADRFDISERTVYRDIHSLVEMGLPIVTLPGEGYALLDSYRLPPLMLTPDEGAALFLAARILMQTATGSVKVHAETALHKITAVLPHDVRERVSQMAEIVEVFPAQNRLDWDAPHLVALMDAITSQNTVHIAYQAYQETAITERDFDPYRMMVADGVWYVHGYCHLRKDIRSFHVNRIMSLQVTPEMFNHRLILPEKQTTIPVKVRFAEATLPHVLESQHYAFAHQEADKVLVYHVHTLSKIQNWLFGFGSQVTVLAPDDLRAWMIQEAQTLINNLT